jgi:hypothetical protein
MLKNLLLVSVFGLCLSSISYGQKDWISEKADRDLYTQPKTTREERIKEQQSNQVNSQFQNGVDVVKQALIDYYEAALALEKSKTKEAKEKTQESTIERLKAEIIKESKYQEAVRIGAIKLE